MYIWKYCITYYDYDDDKCQKHDSSGLIVGDNYSEAMEKLTRYYGNDIISVTIYVLTWDEDNVFEFREHEQNLKKMIEEINMMPQENVDYE